MKKTWKVPTLETLNVNQTMADVTGTVQDGVVLHGGIQIGTTLGTHSDSHIFIPTDEIP